MQYEFDAIGTRWQIDIYSPISPSRKKNLLNKIKDVITEFDSIYSLFKPNSLITRMSKKSGIYNLPASADYLFSLYEKLYYLTNGVFTPLIGQVLSDAGYDNNYSLVSNRKLEHSPSWSDVMEYKFLKLNLKKPVLLDFGAGGKGYLIDIIGNLLNKEKIYSYCIDAGGDILYKNKENKHLRVGLENPSNIKQVIGVTTILNKSICGSAGNRRKWEKFNHIINPHTLTSHTNILATWTIADSCVIADAMATCLFFIQPDILKKEYNFDYLVLKSDFSIEKSPGFNAEIFYK